MRPSRQRIDGRHEGYVTYSQTQSRYFAYPILSTNHILRLLGKYTTLSYCAGDPKETEIITVNGIHFNAFANLGHALRQARHFWRNKFDGQELLLWADQICINQSNPSERSHQVGFMAKIYENATQVLVSLSSEGDRTGGLEWISRTIPPEVIYHAVDAFSRCSPGKPELLFRDFATGPILEYYQYVSPVDDIHVSWTTFVETVLESPWWSRAWIRQEFILSPNAYLMASFEYIHWLTLASVLGAVPPGFSRQLEMKNTRCSYIKCLVCAKQPDHERWYNRNVVRKLMAAKIEWSNGLRRTLMDWLNDVYTWKASDSRDMIYASLGLASESYGLRPDYVRNKSIEDVSIDVAIAINTHYGYLATLELLKYVDPVSTRPSWVPYWQSKQHFISRNRGRKKHHKYPLLKSDLLGRKDGILAAHGTFHGAAYWSPDADEYGKRTLQTSKLEQLGADGARPGDEVWMLYGCCYLTLLRPKGKYYRFINLVYGQSLAPLTDNALIEEVIALTEANHPIISYIEIC